MVTLIVACIFVSIATEAWLIWVLRANSPAYFKPLAIMSATLNILGVTLFLAAGFAALPAIVAVVSVFRTINIARIMTLRMNIQELKRRARRTAMLLSVVTLFIIALHLLYPLNVNLKDLSLLAYVQLVAAALLAVSVLVARTKYRYRVVKEMSAKDLPTLTVCIPARNETQDLPDCIESVLASTYPKLEVIVLDDCSHDETPEIIKSYAHAGVRFIKGKVPSDDWLPKNSAYERLMQEAKGEIVMFIGVDVRVKPESVREVVGQLQGASMISILPQRDAGNEAAFFIQPIRYWWELGLGRFGGMHPPVLSACWAASVKELKKIGGFKGVRKAVNPEASFARVFSKKSRYRFLVANDVVGVASTKSSKAQSHTALRMRYAQMRRRPEVACAVFVIEALLILGPFVVLGLAFIYDNRTTAYASALAVLLLSLANAEIYKLALRTHWPLGTLTVPLLVVTDWVLMVRSLYAYEFGEVIWKERNICIPLLKVEKTLPKIKQH